MRLPELVASGRKDDGAKNRWDLLPFDALEDVVAVLTFGAAKYGDDTDNWARVPDGRRRYFAAAMRHMAAWVRGEALDPETHKSHLCHAICCLLFLAAKEKRQ